MAQSAPISDQERYEAWLAYPCCRVGAHHFHWHEDTRSLHPVLRRRYELVRAFAQLGIPGDDPGLERLRTYWQAVCEPAALNIMVEAGWISADHYTALSDSAGAAFDQYVDAV